MPSISPSSRHFFHVFTVRKKFQWATIWSTWVGLPYMVVWLAPFVPPSATTVRKMATIPPLDTTADIRREKRYNFFLFFWCFIIVLIFNAYPKKNRKLLKSFYWGNSFFVKLIDLHTRIISGLNLRQNFSDTLTSIIQGCIHDSNLNHYGHLWLKFSVPLFSLIWYPVLWMACIF